MNDIRTANLARLATELREDIQQAAESALHLGDVEMFLAIRRYGKGA